MKKEERLQPFHVQTAAQFLDRKGPRWHVRGLFPFAGFICIFGPHGHGKTSLLVDFGVAAPSAQSFLNLPVLCKSAVLFLSLEGNIRDRLQATIQERKLEKETLPLSLLTEQIDICNETHQQRLRDTVEELRRRMPAGTHVTIIIDNLTVIMQGADENNPVGMGAAIAGMRHAFKDCTIILIHHSGHNGRLRGHTLLPGHMDAILRVSKVKSKKNLFEIRPEKLRDAPICGVHYFEISSVEIDHDGEVINTSVVKPVGGISPSGEQDKPSENTSSEVSLSQRELLLLEIIHGLSQDKTPILEKTVESSFFEQVNKDASNKNLKHSSLLRSYHRARTQLVDRGLVSLEDMTKTIRCT